MIQEAAPLLCDETKSKAKARIKKIAPQIVVTTCITASNPRALRRENKSPAPPVKADIASLSFLAGCIITHAIRTTQSIKNKVINVLYKDFSFY